MSFKSWSDLVAAVEERIKEYEDHCEEKESLIKNYEKSIENASEDIMTYRRALEALYMQRQAYLDAKEALEREHNPPLEQEPSEEAVLTRIERVRRAVYEKPGRFSELQRRTGINNPGRELMRLRERGLVLNMGGMWSSP